MAVTLKDVKKILAESVSQAHADKWEEFRAKALESQKGNPFANPEKAPPKDEPKAYAKGTGAARLVRYLAQAGNDGSRARELAQKAGDDFVVKALGESTLAGGGAVVQGDFAQEIIEVLRARAVFRQAGPRTVPMNSGSLTMPYGATGASASYVGENANISDSEPTFGQIQFTARKVGGLLPVINGAMQ